MTKLIEYGIPEVLVNLINFWYHNQIVNVRYMAQYSNEWKISNGVRQGGILSGLFFGIYIDEMLSKISRKKIGCKLGLISSNIIAYADDMVLLAPSAESLQALINELHKDALDIDLKFNIKKTKCMIFRSQKGARKIEDVRLFQVDGSPVEFVNSFKYLGYIVTCNLSDTEDIKRVRSKFYVEFNSMLRNFNFTDKIVKMFLFKQYCLQMYGCELWIADTCSVVDFKQFAVGYHKAIKKMLNLSYHEIKHYACQEAQCFTFKHLINKYKIMAACRYVSKPCDFIRNALSFLFTSSVFLNHVYDILENVYNVDSLLHNDRDAILARINYVQNNESQMRGPIQV